MEAIMRFKKRNLVAVMSCVMMFAAAPLLPAELSVMASAYAKEGGGGNGNGGGGGGNGNGGHGGESGGHAGASHSDSSHSRGLAEGHEVDHDGKAIGKSVQDHDGKAIGKSVRDHDGRAVRDHGVRGHHTGRGHKTSRGHGVATSGVAHSKATHGLSKATAISDTKVGDHNDKGLGQAASSTAK
ncbi:hypothetical protein NUH87_04960 [Pseudomonas batumici]